jgi:hypothetical protein
MHSLSDSFVNSQELALEERQTSFTEMMRLALEIISVGKGTPFLFCAAYTYSCFFYQFLGFSLRGIAITDFLCIFAANFSADRKQRRFITPR